MNTCLKSLGIKSEAVQKNFTTKQSYQARVWYLLSISTIEDPVSPERMPFGINNLDAVSIETGTADEQSRVNAN